MRTAEIRRRFLDYFSARGHQVVPSAPLLYNDPTLLFVNAGMVPFKPYFTGAETPPWDRATSVQKCVRTLDIEEVGKTTRHGTFFQMQGNFSFGDYFKAEAIRFAWELVTGSQDDGFLGFDPNRIWVTVLHSDDEAAGLWASIAGLPPERIQRRGLLDNYWNMGVPGPGGPCSEIYYDRGPAYGQRGWSRRRRGPLPGDLEPRVHAGGALASSGPRTTSTSSPTCRARTSTPAWAWSASRRCCRASTTCTRSTRSSACCAAPRSCRARRTACEGGHDRRRADARRGRPRPLRADADGRRGHAGQRGARLRAAPAAAPRGALDAPARRHRPGAAGAAAGQPGRDEGVLPRGRARLGPDRGDRVRRGGRVPAHPRRGHRRSSTPPWPTPARAGAGR